MKNKQALSITLITILLSAKIGAVSLSPANASNSSYVKVLSSEYSYAIIIQGVFSLEDTFPIFDGELRRFDTLKRDQIHSVSDSISDHFKCLIVDNLEKYLDSLPGKEASRKYGLLNSWCETYVMLYSINTLSTNDLNPFEKVIYDCTITRRLEQRLFLTPDQTWESLSLSQTDVLFYDVVDYISSQTADIRCKFFSEYYALINQGNK